MIFALPAAAYGTTDSELGKNELGGLFQLTSYGNYDEFINYVDGYSLRVSPGMKVDMTYSAVCTTLKSDTKRIEIYKDDFQGTVGMNAYVNYSNKFLANDKDHHKEYEADAVINGRKVHLLQWSRDKLSRVIEDKNYYACMEIAGGSGEIYTIFVKSSKPFDSSNRYDTLLDNFQVLAPTKQPITLKSTTVSAEERGWNQETKDFYDMYLGPASSLTWGIFQPQAPDDFNELHWLESKMDYTFPILLNYTNFENKYKHPNLEYRLDNAYSQNVVLELTLQTAWTATGESNMVYDVLDGEYDAFLTDYVNTIKEFGHPVLFRLGNEMNGDWCPYSSYNTSKDTEIFKEFYHYVYSFFEEAEVENVIWIWNPNGKSFPNFNWNNELMYYPGDEYVDIIGLTAYNTGTYYEGENWTEFADLYDPIYEEYLEKYSQPMMITEFASSSVGGDKNQWIRNMFAQMEMYPMIKVAIWWDGCDWDAEGNVARPYFIDETQEIIDTFRELLNAKPLFWDVLA